MKRTIPTMLFSNCYRCDNVQLIRTIHHNITQKKLHKRTIPTTNTTSSSNSNSKRESKSNSNSNSNSTSTTTTNTTTTNTSSKYIETTVKTVYTSAILDPALDLDSYQSLSKQLFNLNVKFVQPKEFKYQLPSYGVPEFAFVGRSNVGKSSLISTLIMKKAIVKISKEPGCTRSINFFAFYKGDGIDTNTHKFYLVDLPGYGFAKAGKEEQLKWKGIMYDYLNSRDPSTLRRVYILIDSRHGIKNSDIDTMKLLDNAKICYQIILTKSDVPNDKELKHSLESSFDEIMAKRMNTCFPYLHLISSKTGDGIIPLQQSIAEVASQQWVKKNQDIDNNLNQVLENDPELLEKIKENINNTIPGGLDNINYENADDIATKLNDAMKKG